MELVPTSKAWLVALSSTGLLHDGVPVDHFGVSVSGAQKWADRYRSKGLEIKKVGSDEYRELVRRSQVVHTDRQAKLPRYIGTNQPVGLSLGDVQKAPEGARAVIRYGDAFQEEIRWCEPDTGLLFFDEDCNGEGEAGLMVANLAGHVAGIGFAGYSPDTKTWWRYAREGVHGSGEHCLQILALI